MKHKFLFFLSFLLLASALVAQSNPPLTTTELILPVTSVNLTPATQVNTAIVGNPGPRTIYYWMVTNFTIGPSSPVGPFAVTTAPNTLSGSNYVTVTPIYPAGIASIDLLKTSTSTPPNGGCNCAVATGVTSGAINDQSNSTNPYTVSPVNVSSLVVTLTNEVVGTGATHPILRQNGVFIIDLFNIVPVGGAVTSVELDGTANQITITGSTVPCTTTCTWAASLPAALILPSGTTATTQTAGDASASPATDAFVQTAVATISPTPSYSGNQLISGGGVEWTGALNFTIGAATYAIQGQQYVSLLTNETLAAADPSNPRLDVIGVNSSGAVFVLTGTPAANPAVPTVDPTSQLALTIILVPAGSTTPAVTSANIYQENAQSPTEWNTSSLGAPINLASTNNPYAGSIDIEATAATTGNYAQMTCPSCTVQLQTYNNLIFYLRSKATWPANRSLTVQWFNGATPQGTAVVIRPTGTFGFTSSTTTAYQQIAIPTSLFGLNGISVPTFRVTVTGTGGTIGWYLDDITLQGGQNGNPTGTFLSWAGTWNSTTGYNPNQVVFYNFASWVALNANSGSTPSLSNSNWAVMTSAGVNQQVLFNDAGFFNGDPGMLYNKATAALTLSGAMSAASYTSTSAGAYTLTGAEGAAPSGSVGSDILWADSTAHRWKMNNNNGGAFNVPGVASAGTSGHTAAFAANGIDLVDGGAPGGAVYSLQVNGTGLTAGDTVNLNATTPTAPTNGINVTFATSKASTTDSVSAAVVGDGTATHFLNGTGTFTAPAGGGGGNCNSGAAQCIYVPNCGATGTTVNKLAKWGNTSVNNSCAVITATTDGGTGVQPPVIGVVVSGAGTTGNALIAISGTVPCVFDSAAGGASQGQSIQISTTTNGDCTSVGATPANENPDTHWAFASADAAISASATGNIDLTPISPAFGNVNGELPPVMTFLGASSYGGTFAFPMQFYQTNSTNKSGINLIAGAPVQWGDPSTFVSYTLFSQGGSGNSIGLSTHDFQINTQAHGFSNYEQLQFGPFGTAYSVITSNGAASGTQNFYPWFGNSQTFTLSGNSTLVNNTALHGQQANPGTVFHRGVCQNGTGGFTLTDFAVNASAMPAAPNACVWQNFVVDASNAFQALGPATPIQVVKTSQAAALSTTTIATPQAAGMYRVTAALDCDNSSAAATVNVTIGWTDPSNTAQTASLGSAVVCTSLGSSSIGNLITSFRIKANTNITYATSIVNTPTYDLSLALETMTQ